MSSLLSYAQSNLNSAAYRLCIAPQAFTSWAPLTDMQVLDCGGDFPYHAVLLGKTVAYCQDKQTAWRVLDETVIALTSS